jgi:multidrug resistance efflux pump
MAISPTTPRTIHNVGNIRLRNLYITMNPNETLPSCPYCLADQHSECCCLVAAWKQSNERADKAEANLRRVVEIAEEHLGFLRRSELQRDQHRAEINAIRATLPETK